MSEGLVGAKLVELTPGAPGAPQVAELDILGSEKPIEMTDLMQKAANSLARLDSATVAAEKGLAELTAITASIQKGEGSLGKLIRDDSPASEPDRAVWSMANQTLRALRTTCSPSRRPGRYLVISSEGLTWIGTGRFSSPGQHGTAA